MEALSTSCALDTGAFSFTPVAGVLGVLSQHLEHGVNIGILFVLPVEVAVRVDLQTVFVEKELSYILLLERPNHLATISLTQMAQNGGRQWGRILGQTHVELSLLVRINESPVVHVLIKAEAVIFFFLEGVVRQIERTGQVLFFVSRSPFLVSPLPTGSAPVIGRVNLDDLRHDFGI